MRSRCWWPGLPSSRRPREPAASWIPGRRSTRARPTAPATSRKVERADYRTRSRSLLDRRGARKDLIRFALDPPLGLPPAPIPADNPLTRAKIDLGRKLFFDRRLSINDTLSCATCHIPEQGFTNNELRTPVGVEGRSVLRNSPTLYNVAYQEHLFLDGREISLENQVWQPMTAHNEMAAPSIGYVIRKLRRMRDYEGMFERAFDGRGPDVLTIGQALASYQRTLLGRRFALRPMAFRWPSGRGG